MASKNDIEMWMERTIVDAMKKIPQRCCKEKISLPDLQFNTKAKFLRYRPNGRMSANRDHVVQRGNVVSEVLTLDKIPSENGAFFSPFCEGNVVDKYFVVSVIVSDVTSDTVWSVSNDPVLEDKYFTCAGERTVRFMLDEPCRRAASVYNCAEMCMRRGERARPEHALNVLNGDEFQILSRRSGYIPFLEQTISSDRLIHIT